MINKNLVKIIRKSKYWQADGPVILQLTQPPLLGFSRMAKYNKGLKYSPIIFIFKNHYGYQFIREEDSINFIKFLVNNDKKNKEYIGGRIKDWRRLEKKTFQIAKSVNQKKLSSLSGKQLWKLFHDFSEKLIDTWSIPLILEGNGLYFEKVLIPKAMIEAGISQSQASSQLSILVTPEKLSFTGKEHSSLLKIALEFIKARIEKEISVVSIKENYPKLFLLLQNHQKSFYWVHNNYKHSEEIPLGEFLNEVEKIIKEKSAEKIKEEIFKVNNIRGIKSRKQEILKKLKISEETRREIELFSTFGWWQDERKRINLQSSFYVTLFLNEIARRTGLSFVEANYLLNEEIKDFLAKNIKFDIKKIEDRQALCAYILFDNFSYEIVTGKLASAYDKEMMQSMKKDQQGSLEQLRGYVASNGGKEKISGKVCLVLDVKEHKFDKGSILVTSMTRPEFLPIMKQAKAVITSEGGITSHAAIVSRELNIPCIIGTKVATTLLKNGDFVEMDLVTGLIKILKNE